MYTEPKFSAIIQVYSGLFGRQSIFGQNDLLPMIVLSKNVGILA